MVGINAKALSVFPLLMILIKSQTVDPVMYPTQEISTTETESNKVHLWSTTSSPDVKQTISAVQAVGTRPPIIYNPYFTGKLLIILFRMFFFLLLLKKISEFLI